jgi:hypothetical protein
MLLNAFYPKNQVLKYKFNADLPVNIAVKHFVKLNL